MDPLKKSGLKLFYRILKLHMKKLPTDMKNLGIKVFNLFEIFNFFSFNKRKHLFKRRI